MSLPLSSTSQKIIELCQQGLSRREIGERLGLTKTQVENAYYKYERARLRAANANVDLVAPTSGARNRPSPPPASIGEIFPDVVDFEPPTGKTNVWSVRLSQCRFPGEDGFFCGEPTSSPSRSYCDRHHALCWVKTRRQQADASISSINS